MGFKQNLYSFTNCNLTNAIIMSNFEVIKSFIMTIQRLIVLSIVVFIFSCKKNDVNLDKFNNTKIKPEVLTPLANAQIVAGDLLKQDSIIKYDPDGLIRLTFLQDSVFVMDAQEVLKDISLGKSSSYFSIGELTVTAEEENSSVVLNDLIDGASPEDQAFLNFADGKRDTFPEVNTTKTNITSLAESTDYEYLRISKGQLVFKITNGLPTNISNLKINIFDSVQSANPMLIGTFNFTNIQPNGISVDSINIENRTLTNTLGYSVPQADISKSEDSVLIDLTDKIDINVSYSNFRCIGGKAKLPAQQIPVELLSIDLSDTAIDARLRNIKFASAVLPIKTRSSINTTVNIDLDLPDATKGGNPLGTLNINAPYGVTNSQMDLTNANIFLGQDANKDHNMLRLSVSTEIQASNGLVEFDSSNSIRIEFDASSAKFEYLDGYLGQDTFDISIDDLDVSQLAELGRGIRMENPKMRIYVNNSFGIPILVELDITSKDENGNVLPMNVQDMSFPYPSIAERGTVKNETFEINKSNSDIVDCLGMPAVLFDIKGIAIMNPDGFTGFTNHITSKSAIDLGFDADIPMTFTAQNFTYVDTLEEGSALQGLADFDLLELKIKTLNGFPLGGTLDLIFTDSSYNVIDSLKDVTLLQSAVVDTDGKISESSENMSTFLMPGTMLDKLDAKQCSYILIRTNFNSYDNGNIPVSIYTSCKLEVSLAFRAIYTTEL